MEKIPLVALLFHSLPEAILTGALGLALLNVRPVPGKTILYGILVAMSAYFIRQLPLPLGAHTLPLLICATCYFRLLYRLSWKTSYLAAFLPLVLLVIFEGLFVTLYTSRASLAPPVIMSAEHAWLRVLISLPQQLLLAVSLLIAYLVRGFHRPPPQAGNKA